MEKDKVSLNEVQDKFNNNTKMKKMKKNEELQNDIHFAISRKPYLNVQETGVFDRVGKYIKIFSYLLLLIGIGIIFNSCIGGYVASEPSYVVYARPPQPSTIYFWVDGDWSWNNQTHLYIQKAGYWEKPRQGQTFHEGYWQSNQHGKSWSKGHWVNQSNKNKNDNHNR
jgi:hypothetical protein